MACCNREFFSSRRKCVTPHPVETGCGVNASVHQGPREPQWPSDKQVGRSPSGVIIPSLDDEVPYESYLIL